MATTTPDPNMKTPDIRPGVVNAHLRLRRRVERACRLLERARDLIAEAGTEAGTVPPIELDPVDRVLPFNGAFSTQDTQHLARECAGARYVIENILVFLTEYGRP